MHLKQYSANRSPISHTPQGTITACRGCTGVFLTCALPVAAFSSPIFFALQSASTSFFVKLLFPKEGAMLLPENCRTDVENF
jgi:hypothetical protein